MRKITLEAQDDSITIEGVQLTPKIIDALIDWYPVDEPEECLPEVFCNWLSEAQDYFSRIVSYSSGCEDVSKEKEFMGNMIFMKDNMKAFVPGKGKTK